MSFTDGKPWIATADDCNKQWLCGPRGKFFRCAMCGYTFVPGDVVRWQFTNNIPGAGGNPLVCEDCDGPDVVDRWIGKCAEWKADSWWWFRRSA